MINKSSDIDKFEKIEAQLKALHEEIELLSKKKPDDGINQFKLKLVNSLLVKANEILGTEYKPFSDFDIFDLNSIPTNSDVVMILAQYLNCMEKFRSDNIESNDYNVWTWKIKGKSTDIETASPQKLNRR